MKFNLYLDKERDEEVIVYAHKETTLTNSIRKLVEQDTTEFVGYIEREAYVFDLFDVSCFVVENKKVYALIKNNKFSVKQRMYQLEESLPDIFVKINQSCIANIKQIKSFDASISGTLVVRFKNGYEDYVSRRQLKNVKERFGV